MRLSAVSTPKGEREREISGLSVCSWSDRSLLCAVRGKITPAKLQGTEKQNRAVRHGPSSIQIPDV